MRKAKKSGLSDIDDEDIEQYLLTESEFRIKESMWTDMHRDYLEEQAEFERLRVEDPAQYKRLRPWRVPSKKRKLQSEQQAEDLEAGQRIAKSSETPIEAATRLLQKRSSTKLNYDILETLLGPSAGTDDANLNEHNRGKSSAASVETRGV